MIKKIIKLVKQCSKIMLNSNFETEIKTDVTNIVTSADTGIQKFLYKKLKEILPNSGFVGEEDNLLEKSEYFWVVDPIDGTTNFTRGLKQSCISVALVHNNKAELAVVYNPYTNDLYYAVKGKGAFNNGKQIFTSNRDFKSSLFCTAMSVYKKSLSPYCFDIIKDVYDECNDIRRLGSCALEMCYMASGKCELFFEIRIFPWDFAAAALILQEAGGKFATLGNKKYDGPCTLYAANNLKNFNKLQKIIKEHLHDVDLDLT